MNTTKEYSSIGKSEFNVNAIAKVTGKAKYVTDLELPRMLFGKLKRSPYPHAKIISIDTSQAEAMPGVKAVIVGDEETSTVGLRSFAETLLGCVSVKSDIP